MPPETCDKNKLSNFSTSAVGFGFISQGEGALRLGGMGVRRPTQKESWSSEMEPIDSEHGWSGHSSVNCFLI